ncbi:putative iron-regulated protein [Sagittula marina]|uniref:Putative iron-regulated protein n=1 Tax=Sagittula marina TaxID=943940 RepID=A0A7W6GTM8_9RHOB|nr:ChaN family lipoprotein [Sagittula marina]MBB3985384.1 putative iron-regulated protein [Sagittula marina]
MPINASIPAVLLLCLAIPAVADPVADIVILGEVHDNPDAHLGQAAALRELKPTAVVFEMLTAEDARAADADRDAIPDAWEASGWRDFEIYAPIFAGLGDARIVGAAAPREAVRSVYSDGAATLFGPEAGRFGLDTELPEDQLEARMQLQFKAHCEAMPLDMMGGMVAVQRYRDAVFARAALDALETYGPPIAVIAGNGHARTDWGIPAVIGRAAPDVSTYTLGFVEADSGEPFDDIRIVPPAERDDPCNSLTSN